MSIIGLEELFTRRRDLLVGRHIGLVSNYTVTDTKYKPVIQHFADASDWKLVKLFGPEHGVKNSAKEGEVVESVIDEATGLPAYSLYGPNKKPSPEMLRDIDVLVVDLPDIGSRYYTNMNTLTYCMEACGELGLPCVVPDRPNPINGTSREGNILELAFASFVGMHPIPNRHGLTMGELATFINERLEVSCDLTVVEMSEWKRNMLLSDTGIPFVPPSPNTTDLEMALLYPGTCLFEGVNVSLGRGTTHPFKYIGSPYIRAHELTMWFNQKQFPGVVARPIYFVPTYSQYTGEVCEGISLHVTDARQLEPVRVGVSLLQGIAELYEGSFQFLGADEAARPFIDLLAGSAKLRTYVATGRALDYLEESQMDVEKFNRDIKPFERYA